MGQMASRHENWLEIFIKNPYPFNLFCTKENPNDRHDRQRYLAKK